MKNFDHNFRIESMFEFYLQKTGLGPKEDLHPIQLRETRRAFYGACGIMLKVVKNDVTQYDDETGIEILQNMTEQISDFWDSEMEKQFGGDDGEEESG